MFFLGNFMIYEAFWQVILPSAIGLKAISHALVLHKSQFYPEQNVIL